MSEKPRVAVIGAGWAGLAAAVELVDRGFHVEVFEASKTLGGRARSVQWGDLTIDNGQHILLGAYTETLRLMRKVGVDPDEALLRMPLTLWYPGEFKMVAPRLPAPFHTAVALATAQGLDWREKWAALRLMWSLKRANYRIEPDITVTEWLDRHKTPPRQRRLLWEPLCISALNTPAERASAQIMANVLRDSLGGPREASDMLIPRLPLSELFPEPAARYIEERGGLVHFQHRAESLTMLSNRWLLNGNHTFDQVYLAVAPYHLSALRSACATETGHLFYEAIVTVYLRYPPVVALPEPMIGVLDGSAQWLFDRGSICNQPGLIAAVISANGRHLQQGTEALDALVHQEISAQVPNLPAPLQTLTITEKRATFSCTPDLRRPSGHVPEENHNGLRMLGDYIASDYPGTIEGAVRVAVAQSSRA